VNKKYIKTGFVILSVFVAFMIVYGIYNKYTRNAIEVLVSQKKMINILLEGSNVYHDNRHSMYAIASINPDNGRIGITFLPPTLKISMDGSGRNTKRINEIDIDNYNKLNRSLGRDLKMNVPFYIEIYGDDVERSVDILGGIELFILDQCKEIPGFKMGVNYIDGNKTLQYINDVENNSIYRKYDRIQDVFYSMYFNKEKYRKLTNIDFISTLFKKVKTNLLEQEIASLLKIIYKDSEIVSTTLPGKIDDKGDYIFDDISCKIYEKEFITRLVINEKPETAIKVKILNGTDVPGLAKKMRNILAREGITIVEFGTSPYPFMDKTVIINQKGDLTGVMKISELLGLGTIHHIIDNSQLSSALIIIGKDYIK
jgi:polyisoprenyl-teichoic acid--peptidoglycan teichoic acid transferase